jgi:hypothetical protein
MKRRTHIGSRIQKRTGFETAMDRMFDKQAASKETGVSFAVPDTI